MDAPYKQFHTQVCTLWQRGVASRMYSLANTKLSATSDPAAIAGAVAVARASRQSQPHHVSVAGAVAVARASRQAQLHHVAISVAVAVARASDEQHTLTGRPS